MNRHAHDAIAAAAKQHASLAFAAHMSEGLQPHGHYNVTCTAPDDKDLPRFLGLAEAFAIAERRQDWILRHQLRKALQDIPQHVVWEQPLAPNLVVTTGRNLILDQGLAGVAYTAAFYIGLISTVGYGAGVVAGDTMASHAGWTESVVYSNATRIVTAWNAAAAASKSLSAPLGFLINGSDTIKGCFMTTVSTKGGTTGTLYSGGLFTGGDQPVVNGNTLNVSYTASA